jgi:hypothetical protein
MTALRFVRDVLFPGAMVAGVLVWGVGLFVGLFEELAIHRFVPWVFRLGPRVLQRPCVLRPPIWPAAGSSAIALQRGVAKVVSPTECLFRPRFTILGGRFNAGRDPLLIGLIRWQGTQACVECRLFPTSILLFGGWFLISTAAGGSIVLAGNHRLGGVMVLLVGWGIAAAVHRSSSNKARACAEEILAELSDALPRAPDASTSVAAPTYTQGKGRWEVFEKRHF